MYELMVKQGLCCLDLIQFLVFPEEICAELDDEAGGNSFSVYHGIICCSPLLPLLHYHCQYSRTSFYVLKRNLIKMLSEFCSLTDSPKEYNTWVAEFYFFMISISTALSKLIISQLLTQYKLFVLWI